MNPELLIGAGALMLGGSFIDPNPQRRIGLMIAGGGLAAAGIIQQTREAVGIVVEGVEGLQEIGSSVKAEVFPMPDVELTPRAQADVAAGPFLGNPRNVARIAGKIRSPMPGQSVELRGILGKTYQVDAAVENQSKLAQTGRVVLWAEPSIGERTLIGDQEATLAPGELLDVLFTVPNRGLPALLGRDVTLRLLWNGHILDKVPSSIPVF